MDNDLEIFDEFELEPLKTEEEGGGSEGNDQEEAGSEAEEILDKNQGDSHEEHHKKQESEGGKDGKGNKGSAGDSDEVPSMEDIESHEKKVGQQIKQRKDNAEESSGKDQKGKDAGAAARGGRGYGAEHFSNVDYSRIRPRYNWKTLLERLIKSSETIESTYQKINRRSITSIHTAVQTGAGVVRPGEKVQPSNKIKLCLVIDSSGSMHDSIKKLLANVHALLTANQSSIATSFAAVEFSNTFHLYLCTIQYKGGTAVKASDASEIIQGTASGEKMPISDILTRHIGGATNFSEALASELKKLIAAKYNVLIMTDSDILVPGNMTTFLDLYKGSPSQVHLILDSHETFVGVAEAMKGASANISHF